MMTKQVVIVGGVAGALLPPPVCAALTRKWRLYFWKGANISLMQTAGFRIISGGH
jgi:hypothetical protein